MVLTDAGEQQVARILMPKPMITATGTRMGWLIVFAKLAVNDFAQKKPVPLSGYSHASEFTGSNNDLITSAILGKVSILSTVNSLTAGNTLRFIKPIMRWRDYNSSDVLTDTGDITFTEERIQDYVKTASNDFNLYINIYFRRR